MAEYYYNFPFEEAFKRLRTSPKGLAEHEAKKRLQEHGYNEIQKERKSVILTLVANQFKNALLWLLIFAALLSLFIGEALDSLAMFGIITLTVVLGFVQEYRAEKAIEALQKISAPTARVIRDGNELKIPAREAVPGDIIIFEAGDIVAADARLFEVSSLQIDEASLTGESVPSKKVIMQYKTGTSVADQENMAFTGTVITYGKGKGIVTATGMKTEFGKIAKSLQTTETSETPLQKKFSQMARQIGIGVMCLIVVVFIAGVLKNEASFASMLLFSLSLTVASVPNSLPVIVTVGLSMGTRTLAKKNMLIKKLPAAESLGAVTVICSDKTGTLTKNQMTVTKIYSDSRIIDVTGSGYYPKGEFYYEGKQKNTNEFELLSRIGYLCNNAKLTKNKEKYEILGDPTEGSLIVLAKKARIDETDIKNNFSFVEELPFDSDRKMMSVIYKNQRNKRTEAYVKGAPDLLIKKCDRIFENGKIRRITAKDIEKIMSVNDDFAKDALRMLGVAYRDVTHLKEYNLKSVEKELVFIGLVGMIDPPRDEVADSIALCKEAGIKVIMITGDAPPTARAVAKKIGLFERGDMVLSGEDIERMGDDELSKKIEHIRIIARALPIQKLRVVNALKKNGHIVAMTGDGVNDAPALKKADIGIAMGITGTDVAKEVSEATLVDDNFSTIVNAINEGRNIYDKMIKSTRYLLSCNSGEIVSVFLAIMMNFPLPMIPLQILLMNLLTDDFPALGLGFEPSDNSVMKRLPRDPKERPISARMFFSIIIFGMIMGLGTLFMFMQYKDVNLKMAQTVAFTTLVMFEMFAVLSSRSLFYSWKKLNPFTNLWLMGAIALSVGIQLLVIYWAPLQPMFGTIALDWNAWIKIIGISFTGFVMMEISKLILTLTTAKEHREHHRHL
jgi:Ca2+-transporting ATPase